MSEFAQGDDGITKNPEVRPRTWPLDGIGSVRVAGIKMGQEGRGQVPPRGGADDADARRIQVPLGSMGANGAHSAGGILQHHWMAVSVGAEAILQDKGGD